jgi:thiamine pyrophosphate-dependent acetolactate synthase large subunit-like protein
MTTTREQAPTMRRYDCLVALAPLVTDQLVVGNVARTSFEWHAVLPREGNLYTMGMGLVTPVCLGLALALPERHVIALDGDGSILLNLGVLATIANSAAHNLTSIVFDNQSYASTGGLPSASGGVTDIAEMGRAAGIQHAVTVRTVDEFAAAARRALGGGPSLIVAKVTQESPDVAPKLMDGRENKYRFVRYVEDTTGLTVLKPSIVGRKGDG